MGVLTLHFYESICEATCIRPEKLIMTRVSLSYD